MSNCAVAAHQNVHHQMGMFYDDAMDIHQARKTILIKGIESAKDYGVSVAQIAKAINVKENTLRAFTHRGSLGREKAKALELYLQQNGFIQSGDTEEELEYEGLINWWIADLDALKGKLSNRGMSPKHRIDQFKITLDSIKAGLEKHGISIDKPVK